jgi:exodeoxyribonuclease VII small subunit
MRRRSEPGSAFEPVWQQGRCAAPLKIDRILDIRDWTSGLDCLILSLVPNAPKNADQNNTAKDSNLPFEEALKKLETIVEAMEAQDLPLETLLTSYQEGKGLANLCKQKLAEAELKIEALEKTPAGDFKLKAVPQAERVNKRPL